MATAIDFARKVATKAKDYLDADPQTQGFQFGVPSRLSKLPKRLSEFVQKNPTPAGFVANKLPQSIRQPIERNLGRLRNVDIASTAVGGAMKSYLDTQKLPFYSPRKIIAQNFPVVGAVQNIASPKPTFASEQVQRAIPGPAGVGAGFLAEVALPGVGGEIKAIKGVKDVAKTVVKQAPRAILAGAGDANSLSQIPANVARNLLFSGTVAAASPTLQKLLGNKANVKGFDMGRNKFSRWMKDDVYEFEELSDSIRKLKNIPINELKDLEPSHELNKLDKRLEYLARAYLPTEKLEELSNYYGANSVGMMKAVVKELEQSLKGFEDRTGAFQMGIAGNSQLRKARPGSYTNIPEIDNPLIKKAQGFEAEMDQLAKQTKPDLQNMKPKKVILKEKAVRVPSDQQTKDTASLIGGAMGKPANEVQDQFANWVNARRASKIEGIVKGNEFSDLNSKGIQGIFDFQRGDVKGNRLGYDSRFREVKKYFDQKYNLLKDSGIDLNYKRDYLPQLWANTQEEVDQTFRKLGLKPSFSLESVIKNYQEGIAAGLTPKFNTIGDLVTWYEQRANKALADRKFFEYLGGQGMILPKGEAPKDWVSLDPDRFPRITMKTDMGVFTGDYKAPPETAQLINNYLGSGDWKALEKTANLFSQIKNRVLSAGIPYTGWNAHGHNILVRNTLANKNPIAGFVQGVHWLTRPKAAEEFISNNLKDAAQATRFGMKFDVEDHVFKQIEKDPTSLFGQLDKVRADKYAKWFEDPLFQKALPAMKLSYFKQLFDEFKRTMPEQVAGKRAANVANDMFGGINWEQWGRNRNTQNFFRSVILAPDWLESSLRIGKGILNVKNPAGKAYRRFAGNLALAFVGANLLNKQLSGHWSWENEPGNEFNLDTGTFTADGKRRYIRVFGTATDMIRIPLEAAAGLAKGDPSKVFQSIRNRLSIPLSTTMNLVQNQNYLGQPLYGKDKYGNELSAVQSAGGIVGELTPLVAPTQIRAFIDLVSGRNNAEQTVAQALELPIRYKGVFLSPSDKKLEEIGKSEGLKGQSLNEYQKKIKSEKAAFGKKQLEKAKIGGTKYVEQTIENRQQKRKLEEYKDALKEGNTEQAKTLLKNLFPTSKVGAAELPTKTESNNTIADAISRKEQMKTAKDLYSTAVSFPGYNREELAAGIKDATGLSIEEVEREYIKSLPVEEKSDILLQQLKNIKTTAKDFNKLIDDNLLTSSVAKSMYNNDSISGEQLQSLLKYISYRKNPQKRVSGSGRKGRKKQRPTFSPPTPKLRIAKPRSYRKLTLRDLYAKR